MQIICTDIIWQFGRFVVLFATFKLQVHILREPILFAQEYRPTLTRDILIDM